jgi:SSS family transporter
MLLTFVGLYILLTLLIGFWAASLVKNTTDFVVAGRKMPLMIAGSAMFATWFGSETIMGAPSEFVEGGVMAIVEDPFGAAMCLILVGAFIARPLYRLNILTLSDYFKMRFGKSAEFTSAVFMVPSYFGWIAAQLLAMAVVLNVLLDIPMAWGVVICTVIVVIYTYVGGMWAVAITDFVQTIVILIGLIALTLQVSGEAGGVRQVLESQPAGFYRFLPEWKTKDVMHYFAAWITIGLGAMPGQDIIQRVMSAKDEKTAAYSGYIGGFMYLTVGLIPLFIGLCARNLHPELLQVDTQKMLPLMTLQYSSVWVQVLFFGAIISAILSTSSGAILAPSTVIGENLVKPFFKKMTDRALLQTMRWAVIFIAVQSMFMAMSGKSIFELVGQASSISLVSLFVPLIGGIYFRKATHIGATASMIAGMIAWLVYEFVMDTEIPSILIGLGASLAAMIFGSWFYPGKK